MAKRVSHSVLDPYLTIPLKRCYVFLPIPRSFPPEAIVLIGHVCAVVGAIGFALSVGSWVWAILASLGVALNHICDVLDGTHARQTGQCRNGGELLDHFVDPLSFSYWIVGIAIAASALGFGIAGIICLYATAVLTSIRAKLTGEFRLSHFGPTEFKSLLVLFGITLASTRLAGVQIGVEQLAFWFLAIMILVGIFSLICSLVKSVIEVNRIDEGVDTTEWDMGRPA